MKKVLFFAFAVLGMAMATSRAHAAISSSLAFFSAGTDSVTIYVNYSGSAGAGSGDQIGIQFGKSTSPNMDSVSAQFTTDSSGQVVFQFKNLESGTQYRYRLYAFDGTLGVVIFYPSSSGFYYVTTVWVPQSSISQTSYLNCAGIVKTVDIGPVSSNDPNTWVKVLADTGANPTFTGTYSLTWTMPQFNIGAVGTVMSYSIGVTSLIKVDANNPSTAYQVKVIVWNSGGWKDSTVSMCMLPTGIDELGERESFAIFPNPAIDDITVKSTIGGNLKLYDIAGREVRSEKIVPGQTFIQMKDILPGLYFYRLIDEKGRGEVTAGKIVFQKKE